MRSWRLRVGIPHGPWGQLRPLYEADMSLMAAIALAHDFRRRYGRGVVCAVRTVPVESKHTPQGVTHDQVKDLV